MPLGPGYRRTAVLTLNQVRFVRQSDLEPGAASRLLAANTVPRVFVRTSFSHDSATQLYI